MPGNDLVALERQLQPLSPHFAQVLGNTMPPERLMRTIMISVERLPKLLECDRQSLFNSAMSAACLGLEVDGVTGQAYLIPFKGRAQLVIGYKGYNTMAARSGITITGAVVREGDEFDFDKGEGWVKHKPQLGGGPGRRILAAWAKAAAIGRPAVVEVLDIDELLAVKKKSPGAARSDSPWNDTAIGFPAMCEKTVKRRLARSMPLNIMHAAAAIDEAVDERGQHAWISPDKGVMIEGEVIPRHNTDTPTATELLSPRSTPTEADQPAPPVSPQSPAGGAGTVLSLEDEAREAAKRGDVAFKALWNRLTPTQRETVQAMSAELRTLMNEAQDA